MVAYIVSTDQHAGAFDEDRWYDEINEVLIKEIEKDKTVRLVLLGGDWFHKKLSANSKAMKLAIKALIKILKVCGKRGTIVRMIKGTHSHDNNQLDLFEPLVGSDLCDFKIFRTVSSEVIPFAGGAVKILYLPEEYMENQEEYYKEYFNDTYDMVLGHGLVDKASFISQVIETETPRPDAPVFKVDDLESICKGPIYFGHIHKRMVAGRFKYVGSHSVWGFGEEEEKGFIKGSINLRTKEFTDKYINNDLRPLYQTIVFKGEDPIFSLPVDRAISKLLQRASTINHELGDKIRYKLEIPVNYENDIMLTKLLNEVFSNIPHVQLMIKNKSQLISEEQEDDEINELVERYYMLFDPALSYEERLQLFIQIKHGKNIDLEFIKDSIHKEK